MAVITVVVAIIIIIIIIMITNISTAKQDDSNGYNREVPGSYLCQNTNYPVRIFSGFIHCRPENAAVERQSRPQPLPLLLAHN